MKNRARLKILFAFLLIVFCALGLLNFYYKLYAVNVKTESYLEKTFSLISFNVDATDSLSFFGGKQSHLIDLIESEKPDIICFQELSYENLKKIKPQLDSIYGACPELDGKDIEVHRSKFYSSLTMRNFKRYHCEGDIDTLGLDSLELKEYNQMKLQMGVMSAEFEVKPGKWVTLFSGHLRSSAYSTARRSMSKDSHWWEGIPLYYRNYEVGKRIRDYQARNVRRFIDEARAEGKTVIVVGDLNDWCGSTTLNTLMGEGDDALKDAWWEGGNGFGFTYQGWHLRLRLDHILYSDGVELNDVRVVDSDLSDHRPLIATFSICE